MIFLWIGVCYVSLSITRIIDFGQHVAGYLIYENDRHRVEVEVADDVPEAETLVDDPVHLVHHIPVLPKFNLIADSFAILVLKI